MSPEQATAPALATAPARRPSRVTLLALATVAAVVLGLVVHGWSLCLMPLDNEWGEGLIALSAVEHYREAGFKYGLLENMGTIREPLLYTHNVNIGDLVYVCLDAVGVTTVQGKQAFTLLVFATGLFFVYLCVAKYTGSELCGLFALALFCLDYRNVLAFGYNALRAWHWLALFGMLYAVRVWQEGVRPRAGLGMLLLTSFAAFGCGYDFFLICALAALCSVLLFAPSGRSRVRQALLFLVVLALPFLARQIQVASVLGLDYWWQDFRFSFAIKVPFGRKIFPLPPLEEVDQYYRAHHVARPPASPAQSLAAVMGTFWQMLTVMTIPSWGLVNVLLHALVVGASLLVTGLGLCWRPARRFSPWAGLVLSLCVGAYAGLYLLAPFSLHVYMKHQFPLLAALFLVPKAIALALLVAGVRALRPAGVRPALRLPTAGMRLGLVALLVCCLLDQAAVMVRVHRRAPYFDAGWIVFARGRPPSVLAVPEYYMPPHSPPAFNVWEHPGTVSYNPGAVLDILDRYTGRARPNVPPYPGEIPTKVDYILYQPTDRWCHFDAVVPDSDLDDYFYPALRRLRRRRPPRLTGYASITPADRRGFPGCRVAPGSTVTIDFWFTAGLPAELRDVRLVARPAGTGLPNPARGATILSDEPAVGLTAFNSVFKCAHAWYQTEPGQDGQTVELDLHGIFAGGEVLHLQRYLVEVRRHHPLFTSPPTPPQRRQPSVEEVIALYPEVPVVARGHHGIGYVIFDVRAARQASLPAKGR